MIEFRQESESTIHRKMIVGQLLLRTHSHLGDEPLDELSAVNDAVKVMGARRPKSHGLRKKSEYPEITALVGDFPNTLNKLPL